MSTIVAFAGTGSVAPTLAAALDRLGDPRGDSIGVCAWLAPGLTATARRVGCAASPAALTRAVSDAATVGVVHVRTATHGSARERNAHPFVDCLERVSIVHDGVIENAAELRADLEGDSHLFMSDVDSEVVAHLVEDALDDGAPLAAALELACARLEGTLAIVALDADTGEIAATARSGTLLVAHHADGVLLTSDAHAIDAETSPHVQVVDDGVTVSVVDGELHWRLGGATRPPTPTPTAWHVAAHPRTPTRAGHDGVEAQSVAASLVLDALADGVHDGALWRSLGLRSFDRMTFVGSGGALHAGRVMTSVLTRLGSVPTTWVRPTELDAMPLERGTLLVAMSSADDAAALVDVLERRGRADVQLLALTHAQHSTLARAADATLDRLTGPDLGAAASSFAGQVVTGVLVALSALVATERLGRWDASALLATLHETPARLDAAIDAAAREMPMLVDELRDANGFLFLGARSGMAYAAEGARQMHLLTSRWAQHHPAADLPHGPLRALGADSVAFVVDTGERTIETAVAQIGAQGARVLRVGGWRADVGARLHPSTHDHRAASLLGPPWGPIEAVVPLQLFARELGHELGVRPSETSTEPR